MKALGGIALGIAVALVACATLGPAERSELATTATTIERCQEVGRACKDDGGADCYGRYSACIADAGLR